MTFNRGDAHISPALARQPGALAATPIGAGLGPSLRAFISRVFGPECAYSDLAIASIRAAITEGRP